MRFDFVFSVMQSGRATSVFQEVGKALQRRGYQVGYFCSDVMSQRILQKQGLTAFVADEFLSEDMAPQGSVQSMRALEEGYGLHSMHDFCLPEYQMWRKGLPGILQRGQRAFQIVENFMRLHETRCFLFYLGGQVLNRALYFTARKYGIPTVFFYASPIQQNRVAFHTDEEALWLKDIQFDPAAPLSSQELAQAEEILKRYLGERRMYVTSRGVREFTVNPFGWWKNFIVDPLRYGENYEAYYGYSYFQNLARIVSRKIRNWVSLFYHSRVDYHQPYVFFPLHYPNDVALTVMSPPFFQDQESVVLSVARYLPYGIRLYVKEHPYAVGRYSLRHWRRFKELGNISLVSPLIHSHDLIEHAKAVVIINSTVGFEALFYNKPVVVLGRNYIRGFGVTHDVDGFYDLPQVLKRALQTPPDREKTKRFIYHAWKETYPGFAFGTDPENAELLANGVLDFMRRKRLGLNQNHPG